MRAATCGSCLECKQQQSFQTKFANSLQTQTLLGVLPSVHRAAQSTVELSKTKLWMLRCLLLGGIVENQNSDFVMT